MQSAIATVRRGDGLDLLIFAGNSGPSYIFSQMCFSTPCQRPPEAIPVIEPRLLLIDASVRIHIIRDGTHLSVDLREGSPAWPGGLLKISRHGRT